MNFYTFIQWCFRDFGSTFVSVTVLGMLLTAVVNIVQAIRGRCDSDWTTPDDDDDDDDDDDL